MMAFKVQQKLLPPSVSGVPCPLPTVLFLVCLLLSCSLPGGSDDLGKLTQSTTFDQLPGYLFLPNWSPCHNWETVWSGLGSFMEAYYPKFNLSQDGVFLPIYLMDVLPDGGMMSFSVFFTMSIYQPNNHTKANSSLFFTIQPAWSLRSYPTMYGIFRPPAVPLGGSDTTSSVVAGSRVSAMIAAPPYYAVSSIWVGIDIERPGNSSGANQFSVWIDFDHSVRRMSVYVGAGEGTPKPAKAIRSVIIGISRMYSRVSFGFFSSMGQLLQLHTWNSTIGRQQPNCPVPTAYESDPTSKLPILLSSVLGSFAATVVTAAVVYLFLTSRYIKWRNEQEKLTKAMQRLPGVPTQVDYADIKKATKNFHGTMKLGKGGFGAVYRCTLPAAAASRTGPPLEVAVKKFMREVEDRRYDDFLAEVSIINRLRHKNIVPLIGWSYNKGEPVLIYEYMANGSLDQHLFVKSGNGQEQQQQEDISIGQWRTRYSMIKDIATGLHYVHHEHEPMVLHRDIKASNIMLDSALRARLGDFGIASTVAVDRSSVTGIAGTWGYIAPEYAMTYRSTRQTDAYAFGVLVLEVVTSRKNGDVPPEDDHITNWVWRLHREGMLLQAVDATLLSDHQQNDNAVEEEAERLLRLGLACTNPNPSDRPSMAEAVQVITKLSPPPEVPLKKPAFVWPPEDWRTRNSVYSTAVSNCGETSASTLELAHASLDSGTLSGRSDGTATWRCSERRSTA